MRKAFVIARNTAFTFKDRSVDAKEIGKQFGIRYLLEGSLQREQDRTRVNAQLIDAQSGAHLWARHEFEENAADSFGSRIGSFPTHAGSAHATGECGSGEGFAVQEPGRRPI